MAGANKRRIKANFRVDPRLTRLLGENYRSTEHAVKELVDNAWDADATLITIDIPVPLSGQPIIVQDNGCGMTEHEVRSDYLSIANDRYSRKGERTIRLKRQVKGRKGIGKFAGLMVANVMEVKTVAHGKVTRVEISKNVLLAASRDLERIDLPISTGFSAPGLSGTKVTLSNLNQQYAFPIPEKLKSLLMLEYGREHDIAITVNGEPITLEDLPGEHFDKRESVAEAGEVRLRFKVSESGKPFKQSGIAIRISGKIVGKPSFFGLDDDPEIPPKLLKQVYGEVEADALADSVTADWSEVVESSTAFRNLRSVMQGHIKQALEDVFRREVNLQRARVQRQINLRLAEMPEHRRRFAQAALERLMKRFYGESDEKVETIASVVLDAFEKDDYWRVLQHVDESKDCDVGEFASALEEFGLVDIALIANQTMSRLKLLDYLESLIRNPATLEKIVHGVIEKNLWVLGSAYALISSNKTLARTIKEYADQKFSGDRADKRPDLFLGHRLGSSHLLIEFKRPSKDITRGDQNQAAEYRDDLERKFGQIEILLLGKGRSSRALIQNDPPRLKVMGYEALISEARAQLEWNITSLTEE